MPATDPAPLPPREPLPRHTTPTWEMELLISGATVFALMQLPAMLDAILYLLLPRFERSAGMVLLLPYLYVRGATWALIATFLLHLATRGYWVALVGLHSVHPDGIRWQALRWGPHYLAAIRERLVGRGDLVERADNRASLVFGYGFGFALLMLAPLLVMVVLAAFAYLLHRYVDESTSWAHWWSILTVLSFLPFGLLVALDRWAGARFAADGRGARVLRGSFSTFMRLGFSSLSNWPMLMFFSRYGQRRGGLLVTAAVLLLVAISFVQAFMTDSVIGGVARLRAPEVGDPRTLLPAHYADQRARDPTLSPVPYIDSDVASGDWLRLFIPYRPTRDNPALARDCPVADDALQVLDCLQTLYPLTLDGAPVAVAFDHAQDPASGLRGVRAMLPIAELARGRHELGVGRPPTHPENGAAADAEPPYRIPFWR